MSGLAASNIRDVAARAGVSIKTVSRVINAAPNVSPKTLARVEEAIRELDFHPRTSAQDLARGHPRSIAVVIPLDARYVFSHAFFFDILRGVAGALSERGYDLLLHTQDRDASFAPLWKQRRAAALILMSVPAGDRRVAELRDHGAPFVLTCRPDDEGSELARTVSWIDADHAAGMRSAVDHLVTLGHRQLALINGPMSLAVSRLRAEGFRIAVATHGLASSAVELEGAFTTESGFALASSLLASPSARRPTAICCGDDTIGAGVLRAARASGLSVPRDLSVVGFDDVALSAFVEPALTTVRQPGELKGRLAADTVLRMLEPVDGSRPDATQVRLPTELVVRSSTGAGPAGALSLHQEVSR